MICSLVAQVFSLIRVCISAVYCSTKLLKVISRSYEFRGYKKGARSIYMRLLHLDPPVVMNIKKIRRLMRKYGLRCPIRQANPYRQMAKAMKTSHVAKNEINRQFRSYAPRKPL